MEDASGAGVAGGVEDGGPALFRLVRYWGRRWTAQAARETAGDARHVPHILAVEAVRTATGSGQAGSPSDGVPDGGCGRAGARVEEVTVATVAYQLGLDHSGASRIVKDAVAAGYLTRDASPDDRRRAALRLTDDGHRLLEAARAWQRAAFAGLTASWNDQDRARLATYLHRLAAELGA